MEAYCNFLLLALFSLIVFAVFLGVLFLVFSFVSYLYEQIRDYKIDYELYKQVVFHRDAFVSYIKRRGDNK